MTESNLISAFAGESQAHMRYQIYADRAEKSGYDNIARLFRAIAYAEKIHAGNHYKNIQHKGDITTVSGALFGSRTTSEDLQNGIDGEHYEIDEMYPAFMEVAKMQEEHAAGISFRFAWEAEKTHASFYERAKDAADQDMDLDLDDLGSVLCVATLLRVICLNGAQSVRRKKRDLLSSKPSMYVYSAWL